MRKLILFLVLVIFTSITFLACQKEDVNTGSALDENIESFFSSNEYFNLQNNFGLKKEYFKVGNILKEEYSNGEKIIYYLDLKRNEELLGKLAIVFFEKDKIYKTIYEDYSKINEIGKTEVYTSEKKFIIDFEVKKLDKGYSYKFGNLLEEKPFALQAYHDRVTDDFKEEDDGWWSCLTSCYKKAKQACGNDEECDFICDMLDIKSSYCKLSIATACAIYCI